MDKEKLDKIKNAGNIPGNFIYGPRRDDSDHIIKELKQQLAEKDKEIENLKSELNCLKNGNGASIKNYQQVIREAVLKLEDFIALCDFENNADSDELRNFISKLEKLIKEAKE